MDLPKNLKDEIWDYCRVNNISNIDEFTLKLVKQGFTVEKFGATPTTKVVEKEVEKIVEVPVEKIVEKIVEVPVEKEVYVSDDSKINDLMNTLTDIRVKYDECQKNSVYFEKEWNSTLQKLEIEQKKNRRDIYGES